MAILHSLVGVLAVLSIFTSTECARQLFSSSWLSYWQQKLPSVEVPKNLPSLASPLTSADSSIYVQKLQSGSFKVADGQALCQASTMICGIKASELLVCPNIFVTYGGNVDCPARTAAEAEVVATSVYFDQRDLVQGNKIVYPKLDNDLAGRTFLTAELAKAMPFSKSSLSEEFVMLNVPSDSNMAQSMQFTLAFCESAPPQGEIRACHSSIESMVDFAASSLRTRLTVLTPEYTGSESENVIIRANPVTLSSPEQSMMSCHDLPYPYLVYGCHIMISTQILNVKLERDNGSSFNAVATCHTDTSSWNEEHPAFALLGVKPGESHVCHWVPQNNFVWIHAK